MIAKAKKTGFGIHQYLMKNERGEIINYSKNLEDNIFHHSNLKNEFESRKKIANLDRKRKINVNTYQFIISFHEAEKSLINKKKEQEILSDFKTELKIKDIDLDNTQYYVVKHNSSDFHKYKNNGLLHYHIVFNKINNDNKTIDTHNIGYKSKYVANNIAKKHSLILANSKNKELEIQKMKEKHNKKSTEKKGGLKLKIWKKKEQKGWR